MARAPQTFAATSSEIDFIRSSLGGRGHAALEAVTLKIARNGDAVALVRAAAALSGDDHGPSVAVPPTPLIDLAASASFGFVDAKGHETPDWNSAAALPAAIVLRLGRADAAFLHRRR